MYGVPRIHGWHFLSMWLTAGGGCLPDIEWASGYISPVCFMKYTPYFVVLFCNGFLIIFRRIIWFNLHSSGLCQFTTNSFPSCGTYMRRWIGAALVQIMAYLAPSHYLNQCLPIVNWTLRNKLKWNFNQNTNLFIHKNASEYIVCEMAAILFRGKLVKLGHHWIR